MDGLLLLIFTFGLGYFLGRLGATTDIMRRMAENPERIMESLRKIQELNRVERITGDENSREVYLHQQGNQFYVFAKDSNEFLGQGETEELAIERSQKRLQGVTLFYEKQ